MFQQSNIIRFLTSPPPQQSAVYSISLRCLSDHMCQTQSHTVLGTLELFFFRRNFTVCRMTQNHSVLTVALQRLLNILHACLSYTLLHAGISSGNTEVHPLPNKSQSTAFLLYTSRHLACNLPVCRGDLWPPNDPNRRHTCNCSGWRNDSLFQYFFIHTWGNERDFFLFFWRVQRF